MADIKSLPNGWELKKLGDIAEITSSKRIFKDEYVAEGIPFYRTKEIKELSEGKNLTFDLFISQNKYDEIKKRFTIPKIGDVLLSAVGTIGITYIVKDNKPFYFKDGNLMWFRNLIELDSKYLSLGLTNFIKYGKGANTSGSAYNALTIETIKNFNFPVPSLTAQQAIVSKIEELFSELDKGIAELKLAQEQLKVYRQSVLKYAFEGRLTNNEVKDGKLPKGWGWKKISELCNVVRGGSPRPAGDIRFYNGNIPFLKVKDVTKDSKMYLTTYEHSIKEAGLHKTRRISPHTLLLSNSGATLGVPKICMIEATMNDGIAAFLNLDKRSNTYLYFFWLSKTKELRNIDMGAAQPNLNTDIIKNYDIPYCSFDEQHLVVQEIENRLSVADKMGESIWESLQKAEALRQSILKKAFEGQLVTPVKTTEIPKIKNEYFHQLQLVALVINGFKKKKIDHGEMTLAKNLYLLDSIYKIPTGFKYDRWHLGPYPPALKKIVNNKEYFKRNELFIEATNDVKLQKYTNPYQDEVNNAINDLSAIFSKYKGAERSHKTELLATVCKVIEDIRATDLLAVRQSMGEWKIELKTSHFKNKAEKFNEAETEKCIAFIVEKGWDNKLITT